jgi:hypothetical protein
MIDPKITEALSALGYDISAGQTYPHLTIPHLSIRRARQIYRNGGLSNPSDRYVLEIGDTPKRRLGERAPAPVRIDFSLPRWERKLMAAHSAAAFALEIARAEREQADHARAQEELAKAAKVGALLADFPDINPAEFVKAFTVSFGGDITSDASLMLSSAQNAFRQWQRFAAPEDVARIARLYRVLHADGWLGGAR